MYANITESVQGKICYGKIYIRADVSVLSTVATVALDSLTITAHVMIRD